MLDGISMGRSGYSDDCIGWDLIMWRGAVASAIRGKKGQAFLKEMLLSLDAMPEKKLIVDELVTKTGEVCAIGSVAVTRNVNVSEVDTYDSHRIADIFGIANALVKEIEFINDEGQYWGRETPEHRFERVRSWVMSQIKKEEIAS